MSVLRLTVIFSLALGAGVQAEPASDPGATAFEEGTRFFAEAQAWRESHPADGAGVHQRYRLAADAFARAAAQGAVTAEVMTNAANAYAFADELGLAVLFYRRALAIDPADPRPREGLAFLRAGLPIRSSEAGTTASLLSTLFFWHDGVAFRTRQALFMVMFPFGVLALTVALWRRRPFLLVGALALVGAVALGGSLLVDALGESLSSQVVVQIATQGRRGNGDAYSPSHSRPFPPGTEGTVLADHDPAWLEIRLLDGSRSWVRVGVVERVITDEIAGGSE